MVTDARKILHTTTAHEHDGVLLQVVAFTWDVGGDFHARAQANTSDLTQSRVRLLRGRRVNTGAHTAAQWAALQCQNLGFLWLRLASFTDQLFNSRQLFLRFLYQIVISSFRVAATLRHTPKKKPQILALRGTHAACHKMSKPQSTGPMAPLLTPPSLKERHRIQGCPAAVHLHIGIPAAHTRSDCNRLPRQGERPRTHQGSRRFQRESQRICFISPDRSRLTATRIPRKPKLVQTMAWTSSISKACPRGVRPIKAWTREDKGRKRKTEPRCQG